jgi:hypothetical protein
MRASMNIRRLSLEFVAGFLFAMIAYLPTIVVAFLFEYMGANIGHVTIIIMVLFLGYPLGSVLGILLVDKVFFKTKERNVLSIGLSVGFGLMAGFVGLMVTVKVGDLSFIIIPALITCSALVGYNILSLIKNMRK